MAFNKRSLNLPGSAEAKKRKLVPQQVVLYAKCDTNEFKSEKEGKTRQDINSL